MWVRRQEFVPPHSCVLPMQDWLMSFPRRDGTIEKPSKVGERPDGLVGDLWRCDDCGTLWRICRSTSPGLGSVWETAGWFDRIRYHRTDSENRP